MKNRISILFLLIFTLSNHVLFSENNWTGASPVTNNSINNIRFLNANTGIATGDNGTILKTIDGGSSWVLKNSGQSVNLTDLWFIDQQTILASGAGMYGVIIRSTDGGENWVTINSPSTGWLSSIYFVDALTGFVCGGGGNLLKTTDAGLSWTLKSASSRTYYACWFFGPTTGVVSDGANDMKKTTNSGDNWTITYNTTEIPRGMWFIDQTTGFIVGDRGYIYKTTNSGNNWFVQFRVNNYYNLLQVSFFNSNLGLATGRDDVTDRGIVLQTINGGDNWITTDSFNVPLHGACFNGIYGFITGDSGRIYRSANPIGIQNISTEAPRNFSLSQNYPNPFNPMTNIEFAVAKTGNVTLTVYDAQGKTVEALVNENVKAGTYRVHFDANKLSSGVYFYRLQTSTFVQTKKMILLK